MLSKPCDLLEFNFLMMEVISSSLKETLCITVSVCSWKSGCVLEFLTRDYWEAKNLLKSSAFSKKIETIFLLASVVVLRRC